MLRLAKYEPKVHIDELVSDLASTKIDKFMLNRLKGLQSLLNASPDSNYQTNMFEVRYEQINRDTVVFKLSHAQALLLLSLNDAKYSKKLNPMQEAYIKVMANNTGEQPIRTFEHHEHCMYFTLKSDSPSQKCKVSDFYNDDVSFFNSQVLKKSFYNGGKFNEHAYKLYRQEWEHNINKHIQAVLASKPSLNVQQFKNLVLKRECHIVCDVVEVFVGGETVNATETDWANMPVREASVNITTQKESKSQNKNKPCNYVKHLQIKL